jgi:carboxyl-terminal processing protease
MKALSVQLMQDEKALPYKRVPASLMPYVQTAHELGALKVFGKDLQAAQPITKGEALRVLVVLEALEKAKTSPVTFGDVKGTALARAVSIGIEKKWLKPNRTKLFGVADTLTGEETRTLLKNVLKSEGVNTDSVTVPIIRINTGGKPKVLPEEKVLDSVWDILQNEYLYQNKINTGKSGYSSVEGLVNSLDDPYTVFMKPETAENFQHQLSGDISGIGATVEMKGSTVVIITPLPGSPAEHAGLQPGDEILQVGTGSLAGLTLDQAVDKIRGPRGSKAELHIRRNGTEMDVEVIRDTIKLYELQTTKKDGIAHVKMLQFGMTADADIRKTIEEAAKDSPRGIILDLRNNPGGLLHAAERTVSAFLPKGTTYIKTLAKGKTIDELTEQDPVIDASVPVVVLINKGSASASEIVAGALQDLKRATIVGETSFGKGTVQQVWNFSDGSQFKATIAEWQTPLGHAINHNGITPDIQVQKGEKDDQLQRAMELLTR